MYYNEVVLHHHVHTSCIWHLHYSPPQVTPVQQQQQQQQHCSHNPPGPPPRPPTFPGGTPLGLSGRQRQRQQIQPGRQHLQGSRRYGQSQL